MDRRVCGRGRGDAEDILGEPNRSQRSLRSRRSVINEWRTRTGAMAMRGQKRRTPTASAWTV